MAKSTSKSSSCVFYYQLHIIFVWKYIFIIKIDLIHSLHKCKTRIIPYVLTWDGIVTKFHKTYSKEIGLTTKIEAYIQYVVLKKTLESISYEYRRESGDDLQERSERDNREEGRKEDYQGEAGGDTEQQK
jgi:hypothetical protein